MENLRLRNVCAVSRAYAAPGKDGDGLIKQTVRQYLETHWQMDDQGASYLAAICERMDSGALATALNVAATITDNMAVKSFAGDLFVGVPNQALRYCAEEGFDHMMMLSPSVRHLITRDGLNAALDAFDHGAQVVSFVHPDFRQASTIFAHNSASIWSVEALMSIGGFDEIDARPDDFNPREHMQGVCEAYNVRKLYEEAGEEPILAIIDSGDDLGDTRQDPAHYDKMAEKLPRYQRMLGYFNHTTEDYERCIMPGYPIVVG